MAMSGLRLCEYPHPRVVVACRRCPRRGDYNLTRMRGRYGDDMLLAEVLDLLTGGCGRHPRSEHRVGRRDERCEAFFPHLADVPDQTRRDLVMGGPVRPSSAAACDGAGHGREALSRSFTEPSTLPILRACEGSNDVTS